MRTVDEWEHDGMRITVFHMNGRYSLKVEENLLEQTFKFRDGAIDNLKELKDQLSDSFYESCKVNFIHMDLNRAKLSTGTNQEDDLPEIL